MASDKSPKNTMTPFNGDFFGSDGKIRNLDEFLSAIFTGQPTQGKSAYEIAVAHGFTGTEAEWLDSLKGKDGESAGMHFFKSVPTFDDLPPPTGGNAGELYFVMESTGGALAFMGSYKYPRGFYALNTAGEWAPIPLEVAISEDALTVVNISDWSAFRAYIKNINPLDVVLYDGSFYQNLTGLLTEESPAADLENWKVLQHGQSRDGKSAYELAVENGYEGTESEWLHSLAASRLDPVSGETTFIIAGHELTGINGMTGIDRRLYRKNICQMDVDFAENSVPVFKFTSSNYLYARIGLVFNLKNLSPNCKKTIILDATKLYYAGWPNAPEYGGDMYIPKGAVLGYCDDESGREEFSVESGTQMPWAKSFSRAVVIKTDNHSMETADPNYYGNFYYKWKIIEPVNSTFFDHDYYQRKGVYQKALFKQRDGVWSNGWGTTYRFLGGEQVGKRLLYGGRVSNQYCDDYVYEDGQYKTVSMRNYCGLSSYDYSYVSAAARLASNFAYGLFKLTFEYYNDEYAFLFVERMNGGMSSLMAEVNT